MDDERLREAIIEFRPKLVVIDPIQAYIGSIDIVTAAGSVLQVERDTEDRDIRLVHQIKNSLAPSDGEIRFEIRPESGFRWLECVKAHSAVETEEPPVFNSKMEKAAYLIKQLLADGDMSSKEIYERLEEQGIGHRTAEDTKKAIGVRCYRKKQSWYWSLKPKEGRK